MGLTDEQKSDYKQAFESFDEKGTGSLPIDDLGTVMRSLMMCPTEAEMADIKAAVGGDSFTYDQLCAQMEAKLPSEPTEDETLEAFRVFDKDGKGSLDDAGLTHILANLGEKMSPEEVAEALKEAADFKGSNGDINVIEWVKNMRSS